MIAAMTSDGELSLPVRGSGPGVTGAVVVAGVDAGGRVVVGGSTSATSLVVVVAGVVVVVGRRCRGGRRGRGWRGGSDVHRLFRCVRVGVGGDDSP